MKIEGRNPVREILKSNSTVEKITIENGSRDAVINEIIKCNPFYSILLFFSVGVIFLYNYCCNNYLYFTCGHPTHRYLLRKENCKDIDIYSLNFYTYCQPRFCSRFEQQQAHQVSFPNPHTGCRTDNDKRECG